MSHSHDPALERSLSLCSHAQLFAAKMGKKRKQVVLCDLCKKTKHPAISAAKLGHESCLITAYRDLGVFNERDDYGATPIHYAARNGRVECLEWLVKYSGISPNAAAHNGATAAHDAAAVGHLDCLQFLLQHTHCSARDKTVEGASVLHIACRFGRSEVVRWLLSRGDSSSVDKGANNVTPVHLAAAKNHLECLKLLTTHSGYIPNIKTVHGATPIYFSAQEGSLECLQWLFKDGRGDLFMTAEDGMGPIHAAAQAGQLRCLVWMVEVAGISPNHQAKDGATPAHFAAASGQVGCLEWILDNGGSAKGRDNLGGTPVHDAAEQGQVEALTVLIKRGVNVRMEDYDGLMPFDLAKDNKHHECMKLLFKAINTNLLISLTPHHSLSRASQCSEDDDDDKDRAANRLEKQRLFEEAMLAGISEERQEALWESAQQNQVMRTQPGLRMLLQGEIPPAASEVSLGNIPPADAPMVKQRRSYRSHGSVSVHRSSLGSDLFRDHPTKIRPALDPSIFLPDQNAAEASPLQKKSKTKATEVQVKTKPAVSPIPPLQSPSLQAPNRLSFLKRLKFKRKFVSPRSDKSKNKVEAKSKKEETKHFKLELEDSLQEIESLSDEGDLLPESLELTKPSLYEQVHTLPQGSLEDLNAPTKVIAEVVVHEVCDAHHQQHHDAGLAEETIISSTRGTDTNQSPYEEVAVAFSTRSPEVNTSHNLSSTNSSDTELDERRLDEESSSEEEIDKDVFDKFGQPLNGEDTQHEHRDQPVHRDTVEHSRALEAAEVVSTGSDDTVVIREDPDDLPIIKPSGQHDLLKEAAAVLSDRIKKDNQGPDEVVMELRGLSEAGGVQKLINQMKGSGKDAVEDTTANTAGSPQDRQVFKRGGVNEKLRLFGEKQDNSPVKSSDSEEEEEDTISPLPGIKQGIVHSYSQERLRIDGRSPELSRKANSPSLASPQEKRKAVKSLTSNVQALHSASLESPSRVRKMAAVYSPLIVSNDVQTVGEASRNVDLVEDTSSREEAGSHTLTLYMNSANMPHIKQARQQQEMAKREQVEQQIDALLEEPQLTGDAVPAIYQHLDLSAGLLTVWKVMDDGNVEILATEEKLITSHCYICLEVSYYGPILYHIYQWIGKQASIAMHSSLDTQCNMLFMSLPGRPVIYRHWEGYETQHFIDLYGSLLIRSAVEQSSEHAYYNESVKKPTLYKWSEDCLIAEEIVLESVLQQSDVCVLDTPTNVWVWLSGDYNRTEQPTPFTLVNEFLKQQEYPQYTPVVVLSQHAETTDFCDQFPVWTHRDLLTSSRAADLRLENSSHDQSPGLPVGQTKVWSVSATGDKHPVPLDLFGHFFSDQTYLITFTASQHKTTSVYIWIGSNVWKRQEAISSALSKRYIKEASSEIVIVPESAEPAGLLSLFKGKFIVHKTTLMAKPTHLYCVSGEKSLQMKTTEILPQSSNLSTCHSFLLKTSSNVYAWSGQYSLLTERRAALLIAKVVAKNRELTVICEGLEPPEFWAQLGGKQPYTHYEETKVKTERYSVYYYNATSGVPVWCPVPRLQRIKDKDQCYIACCGDQLVLRVSEKILNSLQRTAAAVIEEFTSQYYSHKSLTSFVITLSSSDSKKESSQTWMNAAQHAKQQHVYQIVHAIKTDEPPDQSHDNDNKNELQQTKEETVILRDVPTAHPLLLTISQEKVFAHVQELQAALEESMNQQQPNHINQQRDRSSKLRTSAAMEQLHHVIEDLDSMRHTTTTSQSPAPSSATSQLATSATPKQQPATTTTTQPPLVNGSVVTAVQTSPPIKPPHEAKSLPVSPRKVKFRQEKDTAQKLIRVSVAVEENDGKVELQVREDAPAITIIFRALDKMGLPPRVDHALFEVCTQLNIERALEDHESVADVMSYWPSKLRPQLVVKPFPAKYLVWDANPPIAKESITKFLNEGEVPEITTKLQYCKKPKTMTKWVEGPFCLGTLGMYAISEAKRASRLDLLASTDHRLYTSVQQPVATSGKNQLPPTPHCFIMKSVDSWKQKDLKLFCAPDEATLNVWITALRLVKYGSQLKRNYLAMRKRIHKMMAQHDPRTH